MSKCVKCGKYEDACCCPTNFIPKKGVLMDRFERIDNVSEQLNSFVDRTRKEYELAYAEMIGIMIMSTLDLWHESAHEDIEDD